MHHNPNNVRKVGGGGDNGHVRIVFHVKKQHWSIKYQYVYNTNNGEGVNAMFQMLFWRKHQYYGTCIKLLDAPHSQKWWEQHSTLTFPNTWVFNGNPVRLSQCISTCIHSIKNRMIPPPPPPVFHKQIAKASQSVNVLYCSTCM